MLTLVRITPRLLFFSMSSSVFDRLVSSSKLRLFTGGRLSVTTAYPLLLTSTCTKSLPAAADADWYRDATLSEVLIELTVKWRRGNISSSCCKSWTLIESVENICYVEITGDIGDTRICNVWKIIWHKKLNCWLQFWITKNCTIEFTAIFYFFVPAWKKINIKNIWQVGIGCRKFPRNRLEITGKPVESHKKFPSERNRNQLCSARDNFCNIKICDARHDRLRFHWILWIISSKLYTYLECKVHVWSDRRVNICLAYLCTSLITHYDSVAKSRQ